MRWLLIWLIEKVVVGLRRHRPAPDPELGVRRPGSRERLPATTQIIHGPKTSAPPHAREPRIIRPCPGRAAPTTAPRAATGPASTARRERLAAARVAGNSGRMRATTPRSSHSRSGNSTRSPGSRPPGRSPPSSSAPSAVSPSPIRPSTPASTSAFANYGTNAANAAPLPTVPSTAGRVRSRTPSEGERVLRGAAPPTPPSRTSLRCARLWAHPPTLGFLLCGGCAPTPPPGSAAPPPAPRTPAPSPCDEGWGEGTADSPLSAARGARGARPAASRATMPA